MIVNRIINSKLKINNKEISLTDAAFYVLFAAVFAIFILNSTALERLIPAFGYIHKGISLLSMPAGDSFFCFRL